MTIPFYQPLFDHMANEHGLILMESEMDEIVRICRELIKAEDEPAQPSTTP